VAVTVVVYAVPAVASAKVVGVIKKTPIVKDRFAVTIALSVTVTVKG
jgi:hypothetical protein